MCRAGQVLFQIDPRPFQAEYDRLSAELQGARARAALARSDADRGQRLFDQQAIARGEYERLQSVAQVAASDAGAAEAALQAARLNLSFTRVTSPIDGRVSKALITKGNLVTTTSLLTTVVSDGRIYASFNADEQTYLKYASAERGQSNPGLSRRDDRGRLPPRGPAAVSRQHGGPRQRHDPRPGGVRQRRRQADARPVRAHPAEERPGPGRGHHPRAGPGQRSRQAVRPGARPPEPRPAPRPRPRPRPGRRPDRQVGPGARRPGGDGPA